MPKGKALQQTMAEDGVDQALVGPPARELQERRRLCEEEPGLVVAEPQAVVLVVVAARNAVEVEDEAVVDDRGATEKELPAAGAVLPTISKRMPPKGPRVRFGGEGHVAAKRHATVTEKTTLLKIERRRRRLMMVMMPEARMDPRLLRKRRWLRHAPCCQEQHRKQARRLLPSAKIAR